MIATYTARLAFADRVLAALAHLGPCSSETLIDAVGNIHCACWHCEGRARPALAQDLSPTLRQLARYGHIVGILEPVDGEETWDVMWRRIAPAAALDLPEP